MSKVGGYLAMPNTICSGHPTKSGRAGKVSHTLREIGIENVEEIMIVINSHSHKSVYYNQTEMMNATEQSYFNDIFRKLVKKYNFVYTAS